MHTPTKTQWQKVIDNLEKVVPIATVENNLDMHETKINTKGHVCGTIHCMGGWYAIATLDITEPISFLSGAIEMAKDLGFESISEIEDWARSYSKIWGNEYGGSLFCRPWAYNDAKTIQEAIEYLKGVRDRSPGRSPKLTTD